MLKKFHYVDIPEDELDEFCDSEEIYQVLEIIEQDNGKFEVIVLEELDDDEEELSAAFAEAFPYSFEDDDIGVDREDYMD